MSPNFKAFLLGLALVLCLVWLTACSTQYEVLVGSKLRDGGFYGSGPTATFRARHELGKGHFIEYEHTSHLISGPPFGPTSDEDSLDQISYGYRFGD